MSQAPRSRRPSMPKLLIIIGILIVILIGILIGIVGLFLLLLGAGVMSPAVAQVLGITLDVKTATPGIIAMVIGFGTAASVALLARSRSAAHPRMMGRRRERIPPELPKEMQTGDVWQSLGERPPYFS
jgi:hypothetical protein